MESPRRQWRRQKEVATVGRINPSGDLSAGLVSLLFTWLEKDKTCCPRVTPKAIVLIWVRPCKRVFSSLLRANSSCANKQAIHLPCLSLPCLEHVDKTSLLSQHGFKLKSRRFCSSIFFFQVFLLT